MSKKRNEINTMSKEKTGNLKDISDILIVQKIRPRDPSPESEEELYGDAYSESDKEKEWELQAKELEAIIQKQHQMLKADKRGKQALASEIAAIKQKQEKRLESLRNRERALEIERERARRIALLPPPLLKSVKILLKKHDEPKLTSKPAVHMPGEIKVVGITPTVFNHDEDNKENVLNPEELEAKRMQQEEWNLKAQKRFKEALRKDREKEECENIMKNIQNAELQNRLRKAKSVSSDKNKVVPCPLSDKLQTAKKQTDMEDVVEKAFKKTSKEHVIEDIDGYEDFYETKYKKIDSEFEAKMIDCVPSFVKENYEYLLHDESKFEGGKHFSASDDSTEDVFNQAYIETPPLSDERKDLDYAIDQLDKRRHELQTEYDQIVKPSLVASLGITKKNLSDKAVETSKQPSEDKAVETEYPFLTTIVPPHHVDYPKLMLNALNRRHMGRFMPPFSSYSAPDMHKRDVLFTLPAVPLREESAIASWSSSSHCSFPSKHGFPNIPGSTESIKCDICAADRDQTFPKENLYSALPKQGSTEFQDISCGSLTNKSSITSLENVSPKQKTPLSNYVQQIAKKYLGPRPSSFHDSAKWDNKSPTETYKPTHSNSEMVTPPVEKEVIDKSGIGLLTQPILEPAKVVPVSEADGTSKTHLSHFSVNIDSVSHKTNDKEVVHAFVKDIPEGHRILQNTANEKVCETYSKKEDKNALEMQKEYLEYDAELKRLQVFHQVLTRKTQFNSDISSDPSDENDSGATENVSYSPENDLKIEMGVIPHVYHELSTIQEIDSALTAGSLRLSQSLEKSLVKSDKENSKIKLHEENIMDSSEKLKIVSLMAPIDSKIAELAKSISFVASPPGKETQPSMVAKTLYSDSSDVTPTTSKENMTSSHTSTSSSSIPYEKAISSSLTGSRGKDPYLRNTETLSKYFKDVSDVKQNSSESLISSAPSPVSLSTDKSSISSSSPSVPSVIDTKIKEVTHSKYDPATGSSLVSRYFNRAKGPYLSNSNNFYPMTPYSDLSTPSISANSPARTVQETEVNRREAPISESYNYAEIFSSERNESFKPMTPCSDISSPETVNLNRKDHAASNGANNTVRTVQETEVNRKVTTCEVFNHAEIFSSECNGSFKPMTPCSDISSPETINLNCKYDMEKSAGSFKPMSPKSTVSSPTLSSHNIVSNEENTSQKISKFNPVTLRFNVPTPQSILSDKTNSQRDSVKKMPEINLDFRAKIKLSKQEQLCKNLEKEVSLGKKNQSQLNQNELNKPKSKLVAHSCSSDFFVPQICAADTSSSQTMNDLEEGTLTKISQIDGQKPSKSGLNHPDQLSTVQSCSFVKIDEILNKLKYPTDSTSSNSDSNSKESLGKVLTEKKPADGIKRFAVTESEFPRNSKKQYSSLKAISSTSSSENLSDMFTASKIAYQSTPIKNWAEFPEESKLISDESDLSLVQFTLCDGATLLEPSEVNSKGYAAINLDTKKQKPTAVLSNNDSKTSGILQPAKSASNVTSMQLTSKNGSQSSILPQSSSSDCKTPSVQQSSRSECEIPRVQQSSSNTDCITPRLQKSFKSGCQTPSNPSPYLSSANTPSMISFLHHEMSCLQDDISAVSSPLKEMDSASEKPKKKSQSQNATPRAKKQEFPENKYKQRTKRLWSNLEEVKKKNSAQEQKKLMVANRQKAKEYGKKIAAKKKS